ncbi:uncharacterized protein BYT42DRAFT_273721 [Radiomyces spectabilis]|uniref:uncharacterized protein n=1 Tax=Radiomyces spectabilis TaxID=64574 RepID=UPI002220870B|nr:uncharacterized protein BYT42DRAFT_273721 [Radiomyces spectabilis]KAI8384768.1 hypothetical protein BYT42DRAFT_273721 [Radiomyces spectabilis]
MDISPLEILTWIHPSRPSNTHATPRIDVVAHADPPCVTVQGTEDTDSTRTPRYIRSLLRISDCISSSAFSLLTWVFCRSSQQFHFTKCFYADNLTNNCDNETQNLVRMALDGYTASAIFMTLGAADAFKYRQDTLYQLLRFLGSELETVNQTRKKQHLPDIHVDYACLGVTDNYCFDIRKEIRLKSTWNDQVEGNNGHANH